MPALHLLERLEMHVTHACNLSCESCSHYSNHNHSGNLSLVQAATWLSAWHRRLVVNEFVLLGGEPTIHPNLPQFLPVVRHYWPQAKLTIITNGFFLGRHPELPRIMKNCGNVQLEPSIHHNSLQYQKRLQPILTLIARWEDNYGISVTRTHAKKSWTRRYIGFGSEMQPFEDGNPRSSWEICKARTL